ncbi:MAG: homoserine dehydrogenase [Saccharofermentanales bacterium]|jgi:homoserine dehydrogenase
MIGIALAGYGTVGQGVMDLFQKRKESIQKRLGKKIDIRYILVRDSRKKRDIDLYGAELVYDIRKILDDDNIKILIEATGDITLGYKLIKEALKKKKHVITANKAVLSLHLEELSTLAEEQDVYLLYEASVGGGTPLIKPLQELSLHGEIRSLRGLLSGSCNYVLSKMRTEQIPYDDVLEEAKNLGYLEADPIDDVGGFDTRRKLRILATLAFRGKIEEDDISLEGITKIEQEDISRLFQMGYAVRLVAQAFKENQIVQATVHPMALPINDFLRSIDKAENGVEFFGDHFIKVCFQGSGSGRYPTAHAMLSDLEDILFSLRRKISPLGSEELQIIPYQKKSRYYIRNTVPTPFAIEEQIDENVWITTPVAHNVLKETLPEGAVAIAIGE